MEWNFVELEKWPGIQGEVKQYGDDSTGIRMEQTAKEENEVPC
jgi:hypothetical protein